MRIDKTLKQFIATVLTIIMIVTVIPFVPVALGIETEEESENYAYADIDWSDPKNYLHFTAVGGDVKMQITCDGDCTPALFRYSTDPAISNPGYSENPSSSWTLYNCAQGQGLRPVITIKEKETLYIVAATEGQHLGGSGIANNHTIDFSGSENGKIKAGGSVMSLISQTNNPNTPLAPNEFAGLFSQQVKLITAPELPATTLTSGCYAEMFYLCTGLTKTPELPATTLAENCYYRMFYRCTGLTEAKAIKATTVATNSCYNMFYDCTSLITGPSILPAMTLAERCYYQMFCGCTNLIVAPELPATTLVTDCYYAMFACGTGSKINSIKVGFTAWPEQAENGPLNGWLYGAPEVGTLYCSEKCDDVFKNVQRGMSTIPKGWTVVTNGQQPEPQEASGYYLAIDSQKVTLATFGAIDEVPVITSVVNSSGNAISTNTSLSFKYSIEQVGTVNGSVVYGDIYTVVFTAGGESHTLMANCRTIVIEEHINRADLDTAITEAKAQYYKEGLSTAASVSHIVTSGSAVLSNPVVLESAYNNLCSVINAAESLWSGTYGQIDVDQKTSDLLDATAKFKNSVDISAIKLEGKTVSAVNDSTIELAAKGLYKDKTAAVDDSVICDYTLSFGVYTFFTKVNAAGVQKDETIYVVVAENNSPEGLASACAMSIANQLGQTVEEIFGANKDSLDLELLIKLGLGAATKPEKENTPSSSGGNQGSGEQKEKTIDDFVTFSEEGGVISWTAKPGASVKRIAINVPTTAAITSAETIAYIPIQEGASKINAVQAGTNYLKVLVQTGNLVKTYYKPVNVPSIDKPAVNVYSDGIGIYTYGSQVEFIGYKKGAFTSFNDMNDASGDMYYTINKDGVILDKSKFEKNTYTFFFGPSSYVQVTVR